MTRDYKNVSETRRGGGRKTKNTQSKGVVSSKKLSSRFILLASLVIGSFVAFLVYLVMEVDVDNKGLSESPIVKAPEPVVKKPDVKTVQEPRFTFYEKLKEGEKTVPAEVKENAESDIVHHVVSPPSISPKSPKEPEIKSSPSSRLYVLQAGSFSRFKDADKRKANLAFMGVASKIHAISKNSGTMYRVRIGPFASINKINEIESLLKKNNIRSLLMKIKG